MKNDKWLRIGFRRRSHLSFIIYHLSFSPQGVKLLEAVAIDDFL